MNLEERVIKLLERVYHRDTKRESMINFSLNFFPKYTLGYLLSELTPYPINHLIAIATIKYGITHIIGLSLYQRYYMKGRFDIPSELQGEIKEERITYEEYAEIKNESKLWIMRERRRLD